MTSNTYREFTVTISLQSPSWDERDGIVYTTSARTKTEARQNVKRMAERDGHIGYGAGRYSMKAVEV